MIRYYGLTYKTHPAGFVGFRVAVSIGGELHQRYFCTRNATPREKRKIKAKAISLEFRWLTKQRKLKEERLSKDPQTIASRASYHRKAQRR